MGAYSPLPWLAERFGSEEAFVALVTREVAEPVVRELDRQGTPFVGLLYAGLVLTASGVKVIEFNARFGDPETQVVLPRLREPLSRLLLAAASGTLEDEAAPTFRDESAVVVVVASEGYPDGPVTGRPIRGIDAADAVEGVHVTHAATRAADDELIATGGRVLGVVGSARTSRMPAPAPTAPSTSSRSRVRSTGATSPPRPCPADTTPKRYSVDATGAPASRARARRMNRAATIPITRTAAGSSIDCAMAVEKPGTIIGGSWPVPKPPPGALAAPGRFASMRACMNAAIAADPMTEPITRVVL